MILPRRAADAEIVADDVARIVSEPSASLAAYDSTWLRETMFTVPYVGDDATVDMQPELIDDYVIETVPIAIVRPTQTPNPPQNHGVPAQQFAGAIRLRRTNSAVPAAGEEQSRVDHQRHLVAEQLSQCCQRVPADRWR